MAGPYLEIQKEVSEKQLHLAQEESVRKLYYLKCEEIMRRIGIASSFFNKMNRKYDVETLKRLHTSLYKVYEEFDVFKTINQGYDISDLLPIPE